MAQLELNSSFGHVFVYITDLIWVLVSFSLENALMKQLSLAMSQFEELGQGRG